MVWRSGGPAVRRSGGPVVRWSGGPAVRWSGGRPGPERFPTSVAPKRSIMVLLLLLLFNIHTTLATAVLIKSVLLILLLRPLAHYFCCFSFTKYWNYGFCTCHLVNKTHLKQRNTKVDTLLLYLKNCSTHTHHSLGQEWMLQTNHVCKTQPGRKQEETQAAQFFSGARM